jgi:putative transposase
MPNYRRYFVAGGTYFFTIVTMDRARILTTDLGRDCLSAALHDVREQWPFEIVAIVLLPDHWHTVWSLPPGDSRYSLRMGAVKEKFTEAWLKAGGAERPIYKSRKRRRERGVWQRRFYEHTCRDEEDLHRCVDYIHWNPKKHGLVDRIQDWRWSSFHRFVVTGEYALNWGGIDPCPNFELPE